MRDRKGFTLIELIAVVVILGVIMLIAIPSVSSTVLNSRKKTYLVDANRYIEGAKNFINGNDINLMDENFTFYIPKKCLDLDKTQESPFGQWKEVYVVVTYDGTRYQYYFASTDTKGMGITLTHSSELKTSSIKSNVSSISTSVGVKGRENIAVFADDCKLETAIMNKKTVDPNSGIQGVESTTNDEDVGGANYNITSLTSAPSGWTNNPVVLTGTAQDTKNGITAYCFSDIKSINFTTELHDESNSSRCHDYGDHPTNAVVTASYSVTQNGTYYFFTRDGKGKVSRKSIRIYNIDKESPECAISSNRTRFTCTDNSGITGYYVGVNSSPIYINVVKTMVLNKDIEYGTGSYYLIVKDIAGNEYRQNFNVNSSDATNPDIMLTATNNYATSQTVTLSISDASGLSGYYFGTAKPTASSTFKPITGSPKTAKYNEEINQVGTYWASAKDRDGNMTTPISITFYDISATSTNGTYGTVSPDHQYIRGNGHASITLKPSTGYRYSSNDCGGTVVNNTLTVNNVSNALACRVTFVPDTYEIKVSSTNTSYGTVSPATQTVTRGHDAVITLSPKTGYGYKTNTCGGTVVGNTLTISNVKANKTCTVTFDGSTFLVTANSNNTAWGTVSPDSQYIVKGNNATFSLSPTTGYGYLSDNCGGSASGNTLTIPSVQAAKSCVVNFGIAKYTISASSNNTSYGTVNPASQTVGYNETAYINLDPKIGYEYKSNNCGATVDGTNVLKLTGIKANKSCTVTFGLIQYTVRAKIKTIKEGNTEIPASQLGTVSPASVVVNHGSNAEFTLAPKNGYYYMGDDCDGSANAASTKVTIPNVVTDMTCNITLGKKPVLVTAKSNNTDMGTVSPASQYAPYGETATIIISPKYTYEYQKNNCSATFATGNPVELVVSNVTNPIDCTVTFKKIRVTLSYNSNGGSSCSSKTVDMGSQWGTLCSPSRTGYTFQNWKTGSTVVSSSTTALSNTSVTANWSINRNTLVVNANGGGGGGTYTNNYGQRSSSSVWRGDHDFTGWTASGTCGSYSGGSSVSYTHPANSGTTCTLKANWRYNPPPPPPEPDPEPDPGPSCWTDCCWEGCGCTGCIDDPNWPP